MPDRLVDHSLRDFAQQLSSAGPTPGGGSAAAYAGALGASLAGMVGRITLAKAPSEGLAALVEEADGLRSQFLTLTGDDAAAYQRVATALRMPKATETDKARRAEALQAGLLASSRVPLEAAKAGRRLLQLCDRLLEHATTAAISDAGVGALLAESAIRGAALNVIINLASVRDATQVKALSEELDATVEGALELRASILQRVEARIAR